MIILIPPSEGKTEGGFKPPLKSFSPITKKLLNAIKKENPEKLYGLKEKALEKAIKSNKTISTSKTMPAIERYSGVVYQGIDYPTLKNKAYFNKSIRIVSALFGLVKPDQLIPDYKLKIDKLFADKLWNEENIINDFVIDLLPKAHQKAVQYKKGIHVEFIITKKGKNIPAGHNGKFIKGRFIRFLIENKITNPKDFSKFSEDGFKWKGGVFVKNKSM